MRIVWAALGLAAVAAVGMDTGLYAAPPSAAASRGNCPPAPHVASPLAVAASFLKTAVQRQDLKASYSLAAPALRRGVSCAQWVHGRVPVSEFAPIDWLRSGFRILGAGNGQVVLRIFLYQPNAKLPTSFVMELHQQHGGWQVSRFQQEDGVHTPSPAI